MIKCFSHRQFEEGLKGAACFKIFQVTFNSILVSFKCQIYLQSSVLSLLFESLKEFKVCVSGLERVLSKTYMGLGWPFDLHCQCGLVDHE